MITKKSVTRYKSLVCHRPNGSDGQVLMRMTEDLHPNSWNGFLHSSCHLFSREWAHLHFFCLSCLLERVPPLPLFILSCQSVEYLCSGPICFNHLKVVRLVWWDRSSSFPPFGFKRIPIETRFAHSWLRDRRLGFEWSKVLVVGGFYQILKSSKVFSGAEIAEGSWVETIDPLPKPSELWSSVPIW